MIKYVDKTNKFVEVFNPDNGFYMRSGIIDEHGKETEKDPFMRNFPNLLDIGIMGHCHNSKLCPVDCYQSGHTTKLDNMSLNNFKKIIDQAKGKVFSVALGGRGDPNKHENFEEIVKYSKENAVAPTYTTSGLALTDKEIDITKKYVSAVAVSAYSAEHTYSAVRRFIAAGIKTNIHFVLSNESIDVALDIVKNIDKHEWLKGVNAFIFLNFKNVGCGALKAENIIDYRDSKVKELFNLVDTKKLPFGIGFDACNCANVSKLMTHYDTKSVSCCDAATFSAYISSDMIMVPCSFDAARLFGCDISKLTMDEAWNSLQFEKYRDLQRIGLPGKCENCKHFGDTCRPCQIVKDLNRC